MAQVIPGRFTAQTDEPFVVFLIGMWLPLHKDPTAADRGVTRARLPGVSHNAPNVRLD